MGRRVRGVRGGSEGGDESRLQRREGTMHRMFEYVSVKYMHTYFECWGLPEKGRKVLEGSAFEEYQYCTSKSTSSWIDRQGRIATHNALAVLRRCALVYVPACSNGS